MVGDRPPSLSGKERCGQVMSGRIIGDGARHVCRHSRRLPGGSSQPFTTSMPIREHATGPDHVQTPLTAPVRHVTMPHVAGAMRPEAARGDHPVAPRRGRPVREPRRHPRDPSSQDRRLRWLNLDGRNPQMAQTRWQWLRFVGNGHSRRK